MRSPAIDLALEPLLLRFLDDEFAPSRVRRRLGATASQAEARHFHGALYEPLRDFLSQPGKEFRARLVELCWGMAGGQGGVPQKLGTVVEALHAGSLIVDDIQDQSATRRGGPALHVTYGVPVALNAGNWLYFWAYSLVEQLELGTHVELSLYRWLNRTLTRCHEGQALDLTLKMGHLSQVQVPRLVDATTRLKTGALMGLSAVIPAVAASASQGQVSAFQSFGEALGVALQMLDDVGGLVCQRRRHKGHEDLMFGRPTWLWAWLAQDLGAMDYMRLQQRAREVESRDLHPEVLAQEIRAHLGSDAKLRAGAQLEKALRFLPRDRRAQQAMAEVRSEMERLMSSYD